MLDQLYEESEAAEVEEPKTTRPKMKPVKGLETPEKRKAFATKVSEMIRAGLEQHGRLADRWERCEQLYRQEPIATGTEVAGQPRHVPIVQPRVDQLVANICGPLFSNEPYYIAKGFGQDASRAPDVERFVQFFAQRAQIERRYRKAVRMAAKTEPAFLRVHFEDGHGDRIAGSSETRVAGKQQYVGPAITVIHPKNFVCYPLYVGDISEARLVGHRFARRVQEVRERQKLGVYFDNATVYGGADPQDWESGRSKEWSMTEEVSGIIGEEDTAIEIWELVYKCDLNGDGFEEMYLLHLAPDQDVLLSAQPYGAMYEDGSFVPYTRPWYFEMFLHEAEDSELLRANSFVQNLQGVQTTFNELWNLIIDGSMMAATPAGFTNDRLLRDTFVNYKAGTVYQVDGPLNIQWVSPSFDPGILPSILEKLENLADAVSRVSQAGMGQQFKSGTTATEAAGVLAGQQQGLDEYRTNAANAGGQICDFFREICYLHYETLEEAYGKQLPGSENPEMREMLQDPLIWEPNGKTGTNSPIQLIEKVRIVGEFAEMFGFDVRELGRVVLQALDLPINIDKVLNKQQEDPNALPPGQQQPLALPPGGGGGDVPPELLAMLQGMAGGAQGQSAPPMGMPGYPLDAAGIPADAGGDPTAYYPPEPGF